MTSAKTRLLRAIHRRYFAWRLPEMVAPGIQIALDYPVTPATRYGEGRAAHGQLDRVLGSGVDRYLDLLRELAANRAALAQIPRVAGRPDEPMWGNDYFTGLDAIALYGLIGINRPARFLEIGSGNSTRFARRAMQDHALATHITSVDPAPRAEIDALCDKVVRSRCEDADPRLADALAPGDILFVDNSHRAFQNSDATVFFLEWLPRVRAGVLVHIHDIFLPFDYPSVWASRYYSEQYLLATWLLGGGEGLEIVLPVAFADRHADLGRCIAEDWAGEPFDAAFAHNRRMTGGYVGTSMWLRKR
ncbi:MAG: class I SAM-dependent methyltransferase [Burkholderiales bacterium]